MTVAKTGACPARAPHLSVTHLAPVGTRHLCLDAWLTRLTKSTRVQTLTFGLPALESARKRRRTLETEIPFGLLLGLRLQPLLLQKKGRTLP